MGGDLGRKEAGIAVKDVMEAIMHRRAIRRFDARQVEEADLEAILQAGLYAPSAGGNQGPLFVVSQDAAVNGRLGRIKRANSNPQREAGTSFVSREQPSVVDDPTIEDAFYGAPTVVTLFGPRDFSFTRDDCAIAAGYMMLAADARGVGACYVGEGWNAFADPYGEDVLRRWNVPPERYAVLQLLLGYPLPGDAHPAAKPRRADRVLRV